MRCLSCEYDLRNLAASVDGQHRCPECGRAFDPAVPATFAAADDLQHRLYSRVVLGLLACTYIASFCICLVDAIDAPPSAYGFTLKFGLMAVVRAAGNAVAVSCFFLPFAAIVGLAVIGIHSRWIVKRAGGA